MFRKLFIIFIAFGLFLTSTACSALLNTTQKYLDALNKTQNADSLESSTKFEVKIDLSKASENLKKKFDKYKDITINVDNTSDKKNNKGKISVFINAGEFMLDARIYTDGDKTYLKSSLTGDKYIFITPDEFNQNNKVNYEVYSKAYIKLYNDMASIWIDTINNEILSSLGNSIVYTPDGDIKVSQLSLELNDEKAKNILTKLANIISKNEELKKLCIQSGIENESKFSQKKVSDEDIKKGVEDFFKNLPDETNKLKDKFTLEKLKLSAKIDRDSHIIDQTIAGELIIKDQGEVKISFNANTTIWNINGVQKVEIPQINKEDIEDLNSITKMNSDFTKKITESFK